jgi:hypothetical protein
MKTGKAISKALNVGGDDDLRYNVPKKGGTNESIATKQKLIWERNKKKYKNDPEGWKKKQEEMKKKFKPGLLS